MTLAPRFIKDGTLPMKLQSLACAVALASGGLFLTHVVNVATASSATSVLTPSREQSLVARQLATLMDRQHYLNMPLDEATSRRVLDMLGKASTNAPQKDYGLTAREKDILQLLVQGHSTKEAAAQLQISYHTADGYIRDIYEKLQVNTRSGVVAKALKEGLV